MTRLSGVSLSQSKEVIKYQGKIMARSKAAVLFLIVPTGQEYIKESEADYDKEWFPLSQVKQIHETFNLINNTLDSIIVSVWIAKQKGLIS